MVSRILTTVQFDGYSNSILVEPPDERTGWKVAQMTQSLSRSNGIAQVTILWELDEYSWREDM